jgi:hypothetical protein
MIMSNNEKYSKWDGGASTPFRFFEIGDSLTGQFVKMKELSSHGEAFEVVIVKDDEGNLRSVGGAFLVRTFREFPSHQGIRVIITYVGEIKIKDRGSPMKNFNVEVHDDDREKIENYRRQQSDQF